jgi:hypothetical protein
MGFLAIYVNGNLVVSNVKAWNGINASTHLIGFGDSVGNPGTNCLDCYIDNVQIWNRALSVNEVVQLYQRPFGMFERRPLVLWSAATQQPSGGAHYTETIGNTVGLTDAQVLVGNTYRTIADPLELIDDRTRDVALIKVIANTVGMADAKSNIVNFVTTIPESLDLTESVLGVLNIPRTISETVGISDVPGSELESTRTINDRENYTDKQGDRYITISETMGMLDSLSVSGTSIGTKAFVDYIKD